MRSARVGEHLPDVTLGKSENGRGPSRLSLNLDLTLAPPGDEIPPDLEQWSGVLRDDVEGCQRPRRDQVVPTEPRRPGLGPGVDHAYIRKRQSLCQLGYEGALAAVGLEEADLSVRERDREGKPRESTPSAQIDDRARRSDLLQLERDEGVREVIVVHSLGIPHRRRRVLALPDLLRERVELTGSRLCESKPGGENGVVSRHTHARTSSPSPSHVDVEVADEALAGSPGATWRGYRRRNSSSRAAA